jgi:hypothetical protein
LGEDRGVTDHNVVVHTVAIQFADGRIADARIKAATVYSGRGLSSTQARELAAGACSRPPTRLTGGSSQAASRNPIALVTST